MSMNSGQTSDSFPEKVTLVFVSVILLLVLIGVGQKVIAMSSDSSALPQENMDQADYGDYKEIDRHFSWSFHMALREH